LSFGWHVVPQKQLPILMFKCGTRRVGLQKNRAFPGFRADRIVRAYAGNFCVVLQKKRILLMDYEGLDRPAMVGIGDVSRCFGIK